MSLIKREPGKFRGIEPFFSDRFFDSFWPGSRMFASSEELVTPRVDIIEKDTCYMVTADLPGVEKDNIELSLSQGVLTIEASVQKESKEESEGQVIRSERCCGQYLRRLDLGSNASEQGIEAKFDNGSLTIKVPKVEAREPVGVKIDIN